MKAVVLGLLLAGTTTAYAQKVYLPSNFTKGCAQVADAALAGTVCYNPTSHQATFDGQLLAQSNTPGRRVSVDALVSDPSSHVYCEDWGFCEDYTWFELVTTTTTINNMTYVVDGQNKSANVGALTLAGALDNLISFSASQAELFRVTSEAPQFPTITHLEMLPNQNIVHSSQLGSLTGQLQYDAVARTLTFTNSKHLTVTAVVELSPISAAHTVTLHYTDATGAMRHVQVPGFFTNSLGSNVNVVATKLVRFGIIRALGNKEWNDDW